MARYRILEAVELAKMELSTRRSTDINLPLIIADHAGAKHLMHKLTTLDLGRELEGSAKEGLALCERALQVAGVR
jgi:molecular chaperone DnaK (HSP70)